MASFGIGAKLRQTRLGKGLSIDDVSRETRIACRFLEAIEADEYSSLPGLIFTRNFIRQYALALELDPDPLLAQLPKHDESTAPLPNPPARPRSSYRRDQAIRSLVSSAVWLLVVGGAGVTAYMHFNHSTRPASANQQNAQERLNPSDALTQPANTIGTLQSPTRQESGQKGIPAVTSNATANTADAVRVSVTAHDRAWVQVSADGKTTFIGTLQPNETKEIAAEEQVKVLTGNAGALTISLNGKTLEALGPVGQVRSVKLTAEGPQLLSKAPSPPPAPDPL